MDWCEYKSQGTYETRPESSITDYQSTTHEHRNMGNSHSTYTTDTLARDIVSVYHRERTGKTVQPVRLRRKQPAVKRLTSETINIPVSDNARLSLADMEMACDGKICK